MIDFLSGVVWIFSLTAIMCAPMMLAAWADEERCEGCGKVLPHNGHMARWYCPTSRGPRWLCGKERL